MQRAIVIAALAACYVQEAPPQQPQPRPAPQPSGRRWYISQPEADHCTYSEVVGDRAQPDRDWPCPPGGRFSASFRIRAQGSACVVEFAPCPPRLGMCTMPKVGDTMPCPP